MAAITAYDTLKRTMPPWAVNIMQIFMSADPCSHRTGCAGLRSRRERRDRTCRGYVYVAWLLCSAVLGVAATGQLRP